MSQDNELDFEIITDDSDKVEVEESTVDSQAPSGKQKDSEEDNNSLGKGKGNKSNWKKVTKKLKEKDLKIQELKKQLLNKQDDDDTDIDLDIDDDDDESEIAMFDDMEVRMFFLENEDAKGYKATTLKVIEDWRATSLDDALLIAKAESPESESNEDFSLKSAKWGKPRKKLEDLTDEEALKLAKTDKAMYLKWMRAKKLVK